MRTTFEPVPATIGRSAAIPILAIASLAAGAIHAAAAPHHLEESRMLGLAFVATSVFQVAWAIPLVGGPGPRVLAIGAALNGAVVLAWIWSRTVGVPIGPHAWTPEPAGIADLSATLLELLLVTAWALAAPLRPRPRAPRAPG